MALVHLVYANVQFGVALDRLIGSYTRFAAGGFIFLAGLGVGVVFLPKANHPEKRLAAYRSLLVRAMYILGVQYLCSMGMLVLEAFRGEVMPSNNALIIWKDVFLLREGGDLLPFYVVMIGLSPLLLELFRRGRGWMVMAISTTLFAIGRRHPWLFAVANHDNFPPILWQFIFVMGLGFGSIWKRYDALARRGKLLIASGAWVIFALLFVSEYSSDFGWPRLNLGLSFSKVPLSGGETLRYLSMVLGILTTTDVLWPMLASSPLVSFAQTLGRKSLWVYAAHLWVVELAGGLATAWWWMGRWQILFAAVTLAVLWVFAKKLESRSDRPKPRRQSFALPVSLPVFGEASLGSLQ